MSFLANITQGIACTLGYKHADIVATGSGIKEVIDYAVAHGLLTPEVLAAILPGLPGTFGNYPADSQGAERTPAAIMISFFSVMFCAYMYVFGRDFINGHKMWFALGVAGYCILKIVGFALRFRWSYNIGDINVGIASIVFIQFVQFLLLELNILLAHRIFTWRHPKTAKSLPLNIGFGFGYLFAIGPILMCALGQALPYIYFMTPKGLHRCHQVAEAGAIFNLLYALCPFALILVAYAFKAGSLALDFGKSVGRDQAVVQPNWITSTGLLTFPSKSEVYSIYEDQPEADATRIIPSSETPVFNEALNTPHSANAPRVSTALIIVLVSSFFLLLSTSLRVASAFRPGPQTDKIFWPQKHYVMYIFYGAVELLVIAMLLLVRVDLRFYILDRPKAASKNPQPNTGNGEGEAKPETPDTPPDPNCRPRFCPRIFT